MNPPGTIRGRRLIGRLFTRSTVTEVEPLTTRMRRFRVAGPAITALSYTPGQQVPGPGHRAPVTQDPSHRSS